jgi:uncharacterized LabA/DUF88 family protein
MEHQMNKRTAKQLASGRTLYIVDIENLVGASSINQSQVAEARKEILEAVPPSQRYHFYVASSHHNLAAAAFGWPGSQLEARSGQDGADYLVVRRMIEMYNSDNFEKVVLASGDNSMAPYVEILTDAGIEVTVIALDRHISNSLRNLGAKVTVLSAEYQLAA